MTSLSVPFDDFFQRLLAAVVHIGSCEFHIAKRGSLERAAVLFIFGLGETSEVRLFGIHSHTEIVILLVGEVCTGVAGLAVGFLFVKEQRPTALCAFRHRMSLYVFLGLLDFRIELRIIGFDLGQFFVAQIGKPLGVFGIVKR